MKPNNGTLRAVGLILFVTGVLLGMALFGISIWADFESTFYFGYGVMGVKSLHLSCPLILTGADSKSVTAYIRNTTDRQVEPSIQTDISNILAVRSDRTPITVPAHQTAPFHWPLTAEDVVFGHLILVHIYQFQSYILPSADANCGILYLNLPGVTGMQVFLLALAGTLLGMVGGLALWSKNNRPLEGHSRRQMRGMIFLAAIVGLGLIFSWAGWWGAGILAFVVAALLLVILLAPGQG
jgi:hypothetical protein